MLPLAAEEAHGMVIVRPGGTASIDVEEWLSGLGDELQSLNFASVVPYKRASTTWQCNWKLLIDTFLESYHVPTLHKASLAAAYIGAASPFDAFGPHNRIVVPQAAILEQAPKPRDEWELLPTAVLQYFLAPNLIISNLYGYVMTWRFVPEAVGKAEPSAITRLRTSHVSPVGAAADSAGEPPMRAEPMMWNE